MNDSCVRRACYIARLLVQGFGLTSHLAALGGERLNSPERLVNVFDGWDAKLRTVTGKPESLVLTTQVTVLRVTPQDSGLKSQSQ